MKSFSQYLSEMPYEIPGSFEYWDDVNSNLYSKQGLENKYDLLTEKQVKQKKFLFLKMKSSKLQMCTVVTPDGDKFRSVLVLEFKDKLTFDKPPSYQNVVQVESVQTNKKYREFGLASLFYSILVKDGYTVVSDFAQYKPGKMLWKKIARESKSLGLKVKAYKDGVGFFKDVAGKEIIYDGSNIPDDSIWSTGEDKSGYKNVFFASK